MNYKVCKYPNHFTAQQPDIFAKHRYFLTLYDFVLNSVITIGIGTTLPPKYKKYEKTPSLKD